MRHLPYIVLGFGGLLALASGMCFWWGYELLKDPNRLWTVTQYQLDPEPERVLRLVYELQSKYAAHKITLDANGNAWLSHPPQGESPLNIVQAFYPEREPSDQTRLAFEKVFLEIPVTYLRQVPQAVGYGGPFAITITPEGKAYLRSH